MRVALAWRSFSLPEVKTGVYAVLAEPIWDVPTAVVRRYEDALAELAASYHALTVAMRADDSDEEI